jgi:hypothetical protein
MRSLVAWVVVAALALMVPQAANAAPPIDPARETELAEQEIAAAQAAPSEEGRLSLARSAAQRFEAIARATGSWQPAARASDAYLIAKSPPLASAWYWIASDVTDYSDGYLAWQRRALDAIFTPREAVTFKFAEPAKSLRVDGASLPYDAIGRPVALDAGDHAIQTESERGLKFEGRIPVDAADAGKTSVFPVAFDQPAASEGDPSGNPKYPPRPGEDGFGVLEIVTIVATTTLATGIAIGGGYLLFGGDNPRGLDTPEGAAIVTTEVLLIAGGVTIVIIGD